MKKKTISSLIGLLLSTSAYSATTMISADDVVVTASRVPQPIQSVIADVSVITREEIERAGQSTFVELLQKQSGIEVGSNGGDGTVSSIFMRGTNSNQIVVLIDGVRVNSVTDGATYFGNIPLSQIERIEILRGPASSLYGQDALGGVIQIFTKKIEGKPRFNAAIGYGSYNTKTAEAGFGGSYNGLQFSLNVSSKDMDGFSSLKTSSPINSDRDGYRNLSANGSISYNFDEKNQVGIQFFNSKGGVRFDNRYDSYYFNTRAEVEQTTLSLFSKNQITNNWKSILRLSQGIDKNDSYFSWGDINIKSSQNQYTWQNDFSLPLGVLIASIDRLEQKVSENGSSYSNYVSAKNRNSDGIYFGYVARIDDHSLQANIRRDHSSQFGTHITRGIGYGYQISEILKATVSYGTAFKAPTFMDLYYASPYANNPNLEPEKSEQIEISLKYNKNQQGASITVYQNKIKDFIALDSYNIPQNFNANIKGLTVSANQEFNGFMFKGSLDVQSPTNTENNNMLSRRANRHMSFSLNKAWNNWLFGSELIGSSSRYNDPDNNQKLSGYALLNLVATYKINSDWGIQGRFNNILNKDYVLAMDGSVPYNSPGSNLFVSLRYSPSF
jgi:vitamin B12 transporter